MRLLFLGDIVGRSGRRAVLEALPRLRNTYAFDFVVINGENAAGGFGITEAIYNDLIDVGVDAVTLGNHAFDQRETLSYIARTERLIRPVNYPPGTPGRGSGVFRAKNGADVLVINAMGRIYMNEMDCPFRSLDDQLAACPLGHGADVVFLDMHAEATSEKQAMAVHLDGRVSVVVGTHTHVPTADHRILPGGTGYMSDVGMCGDYNSVLGMASEEAVNRFVSKVPRARFEPATGVGTISGVAVEIDDATGLAIHIAPLRQGGALAPIAPTFATDAA